MVQCSAVTVQYQHPLSATVEIAFNAASGSVVAAICSSNRDCTSARSGSTLSEEITSVTRNSIARRRVDYLDVCLFSNLSHDNIEIVQACKIVRVSMGLSVFVVRHQSLQREIRERERLHRIQWFFLKKEMLAHLDTAVHLYKQLPEVLIFNLQLDLPAGRQAGRQARIASHRIASPRTHTHTRQKLTESSCQRSKGLDDKRYRHQVCEQHKPSTKAIDVAAAAAARWHCFRALFAP